MTGHFLRLLEGIVADPQTRIGALPMLGETERRELLVDWNDTASEYPRDSSIPELFEAQASLHPEAVALVDGDALMTYGELNARANRLARHLHSLGVALDDPIGICLERSFDMIVAMVGVLKAGGAYVPLDPELSGGASRVHGAGHGDEDPAHPKRPSAALAGVRRTRRCASIAMRRISARRTMPIRRACRNRGRACVHHLHIRIDRRAERSDGAASRRRPPRLSHRLHRARRRRPRRADFQSVVRCGDLRDLGRAPQWRAARPAATRGRPGPAEARRPASCRRDHRAVRDHGALQRDRARRARPRSPA